MKVNTLDEGAIRDIGHAFGYYDYGAERGLIDLFPGRDAVASYICGYVRMALLGGVLHATSERGEGFIAFKRPGEKIGARAGLALLRALLGSMNGGRCCALRAPWQRAATALTSGWTGRRSPISLSDSSACARRIRGRAICGASWTFDMQFFWNRMENDIDESVERLGELFESFLKSTLQKK